MPIKTESNKKFDKVVGMRVNTLLAKSDMYAFVLAMKLEVDRNTVGYWISGKRSIPSFYVCKISEIFNVTTDWILKGE